MSERPCAARGCDFPDGAGRRYTDFCPIHGKLVADFHVWIESADFLRDIAYFVRVDAALKDRR